MKNLWNDLKGDVHRKSPPNFTDLAYFLQENVESNTNKSRCAELVDGPKNAVLYYKQKVLVKKFFHLCLN